MKANAPERIWIDNLDEGFWFDSPSGNKSIEYTRTDTFIEKACEFFGEHLWEYIDVKNANCDTFINIDGDKLKEDFKNYMERE